MTTTMLARDEALELAHAVVAEVADRSGVRVLFIKGLSLSHLGLRAPRTPADVDVLVDPAGHSRVVDALRSWGWLERRDPLIPRAMPVHSTTLIHPQWPCDLDVHYYFPGIFTPEQEAFDWIWRHRQSMPIAGVSVDIATRPVAAAIVALHCARNEGLEPKATAQLSDLVQRIAASFTPAEILALDEAVTALRARECLAGFLPRVGLDGRTFDLSVDERRQWQRRLAERNSTTVWLNAALNAPWRQRPRLLWRALTYFDPAVHAPAEPGVFGNARARLARLGRGAGHLPGALLRAASSSRPRRRPGLR